MKGINIIELIQACPGTTICVTARELDTFARQLISEARREYERQRTETSASNFEVFRSPEEVKSMLAISDSTIYRMAKTGILKPVWIGGQKRFRQSEIDKIVANES